jgi:UDP-galactopyranose mutase
VSFDLLCFSHLRWDFVFQRPNHLMSRAARSRRVYYVEEPVQADETRLDISRRGNLNIVVPHLEGGLNGDTNQTLRRLLSELIADERIHRPVVWYYTPMAAAWSDPVAAATVVYDVMDELSAFRFAPADLKHQEARLTKRADLMLTGGRQLYEARVGRHRNLHLFPSSVDVAHFAKARHAQEGPTDQAAIPHPRIGYFGVIDERVDLELLRSLSERRQDWQFVLVGPTAKIDPADIPAGPNVHHLGQKPYEDLPAYLSGWDVAMMPFALNDSTRFISPTKTPEYLAGGRPVASTPIADVVTPYGRDGLVEIGNGVDEFESAIERALATDRAALAEHADRFLATMSWDVTWSRIERLIDESIARAASARKSEAQPATPMFTSELVAAEAWK